MLSPSLIGLLAGLLLGRRFQVFALVAIEVAVALLGCASTLAGQTAAGASVLAFAVFAISLQAGYVAAVIAGASVGQRFWSRHSEG